MVSGSNTGRRAGHTCRSVCDDTSLIRCLAAPYYTAPHLRFNERGSHERQQRERDQDKTPEGPLQTDHGTTTIEENVVAKIAGMAARQVPGVYGMGTPYAVPSAP